MGARAANVVALSSTEGAPGEEVTVSIGLQNTDAVTALQLTIPLDENLTYVAGSATASSRLTNHAVSAGVKDGDLVVMVYTTSLATIASGTGELLTLRLKLGDTPKTIALAPLNLTLTGAGNTVLDGSCQNGQVSIRCAKAQYSTMTVDYGAVPIRSSYQKTVTVTNVGNEPLTVSALSFSDPMVFSSSTALPFEVAAGASKQIDVTYAPTERGDITKTLKVECNSISKLNTIKLLAQPFAVNELHVQDASGVSDSEVEVGVTMNNMDDIVGFQMEFELPAALEYVDGSFVLNASRKQDHTAATSLDGNTLRIISYSPTSKAFTDNDGVLATFRVKLTGRYGVTLEPSKAILTAVINRQTVDVLSAKYGGRINIQSPQINANSTLAFGDVPVTADVEQTYTIRNYGSAPLTVSRIVFADEGYSVKETLPMEIGTYESKTITVVKAEKPEGDFATTMNIYSNDPDMRMKSVSVTGRIYAPNFLGVKVGDTAVGSNVALHVSMDNYDAIEGLQFDIVGSDAFTTAAASIVKTSRGSGLTVTTKQMDETTLRVVCYLMGGGIARGSGELLTLLLKPVNTLTLGQHTLKVQNIMLGTSGMQNKYAGSDLNVTFNVVDEYTPGDVNGDGDVDIADAVCIVNFVVGKPITTFNDAAADVNNDGDVDIADAVYIVNYVVGKIPALSR